MLFSSISFLYYFLPLVLALYFMAPFRYRNLILLLSSLLFYFYGEPLYSLLMLFSSVSGYLHGLWIEKTKKGRYAIIPLISSVVTGIGSLAFFKYADFFIGNINRAFQSSIPFLRVALPLGISFYTFQILSYTIDVYRSRAQVQKSFIGFAMYVTLFPQLIAGPIVRYTSIEKEISNRTHSFDNFGYGANRFVLGLAKKVLLANTLGELSNMLQKTNASVLSYWLVAVSFALQVYFDFSGYSDMAIGLGRIFGFHFPENFDYPFISKSLGEFWRRWHISLGTWFRDYLYIPMGGNRVSVLKWMRNVAVVWLLTGLWHGAQWNFVVWGLYFAVFLVLEKYLFKGLLQRLPKTAAHLYTLFFLLVSFVIFNADGLEESLVNLKGMFGLLTLPLYNTYTLYCLKSYLLVLIIAVFASTPLLRNFVRFCQRSARGKNTVNLIQPALQVLLLILVTAYLVDGSFNPFLYFRF